MKLTFWREETDDKERWKDHYDSYLSFKNGLFDNCTIGLVISNTDLES